MEEFANVAFEVLDKYTITNILKYMEPSEVFNLCQVNKKFKYICEDDNIFRTLMKYHFPKFSTTTTPKLQYIALVKKEYTTFYLTINSQENFVKDIQGNEFNIVDKLNKNVAYARRRTMAQQPNIIDLEFKIFGLPPKSGTEYYLWYIVSDFMKPTAYAFNTKEDAINEFLDEAILTPQKYIFADDYSNNDIHRMDNIYDIILEEFIQKTKNEVELFENAHQIYDEELDAYTEYEEHEITKMLKIWEETRDPNVLMNNDDFMKFLRETKYPHDISRNGLFDYIMKNSFYLTNPDESWESYYNHFWKIKIG